MEDVLLNCALGDGEAEFEQFAVNAFSTPQQILLRDLLDQGDGLRGQFGTTAPIAGFELPEQPKALAMPTEERVGFEDEEGILPVLHVTGQEDKPEVVGLSKGWLFDLAMQDDQSLREQRILVNQFGSTTREVGGGSEYDRVVGRLGKMQESLIEGREQADEQLDEQVEDGRHMVGLQKDCQELSADCIRCSVGVKFRSDVGSRHHSGFPVS